jgi:hypothetical protein
MSKKQYIGLIVVLLLAGAFAFYWYSWRPARIKGRCYAEAEFDPRVNKETSDLSRRAFINNYYDDCLKRFGIK